ncbi:g7109 [Coccomyxa viridis]|uniref:G7109 protein n=1 Tax=Coccomyxa viridis TaxID=1274662 RepID=A0ABP1FY72_9CHLO
MTACYHQWDKLPVAGKACLETGAAHAEVQGCIRHMCVFAGYAPCLAASKTLHSAGVLQEASPGKSGGQPGTAFSLVYGKVTDRVWETLYSVDGVLADWIRRHAYGDVYSSPGLDLRQKQLLASAFLAEANMHDEMFGHLLAAMRFGADEAACLAAIRVAFSLSPAVEPPYEDSAVYKHALTVVHKAAYKTLKRGASSFLGTPPQVEYEDKSCIRVPQLPRASQEALSRTSSGSSSGISEKGSKQTNSRLRVEVSSPVATMVSRAMLALVAVSLVAVASADINTIVGNFALNLECLEAEFYSWAVYGHGLNSTLLGGGPGSVGGKQATFVLEATRQYATEIANDEINHVADLRALLGSAALPCPALDIGPAFAAAVVAALGTQKAKDIPFSPYDNDLFFLHGAFLFEDVGVTAYEGGAGLITNPTVLGYAAKILAVEAYHAGIIRTLLFQDGAVPLPYDIQVVELIQKISTLRATLGGGSDQGIVSPSFDKGTYYGATKYSKSYTANLVPTDNQSLAFARTVRQVQNIVYGAIDATSGLFFPNGMNLPTS